MRRLTTRRSIAGLVLAIASLAVASCGGSSATSTSSEHTSAGTQSSGATSSSGSPSATTSGSTTTSGPTTTTNTTAATAAGTATQSASAASSTSAQSAAKVPDTNVRLPASFTIGAHGALKPPLVAAPKHTDIELTVRSGDRRVHTFMLRTSPSFRLTVSGGRPARALLKGIAVGTYTVEVDGVARGKLIIGAAPGP